MRLLRFVLISLIVLFLLITGISLFIPSKVRISRATNIKANRDSVLAPIKDPARWRSWHPGLDTMALVYKDGKAKGVVLDAANNVSMLITSTDSDQVTAQFSPRKMKPVTNAWKAIEHADSDSVTLQWYMDFQLRWYPWEKFGSLILEKSHGAKMEQGLTNLRTILHEAR